MDPEEIMRRVPGLTRKEAEHIVKVRIEKYAVRYCTLDTRWLELW